MKQNTVPASEATPDTAEPSWGRTWTETDPAKMKIPYHKIANVLPMLEGAEAISELADDVKANGLIEPVVVHQGKVLDGRNRQRACRSTGTPCHYVEFFGDDDAALRFVVSKNIRRRHLTAEQRRYAIEQLLKLYPEQSNRAVARQVGMDHKTVRVVRDDLVRRGEIPHVSTVTDSLGRSQPATKPAPETPAEPGPIAEVDQAVEQVKPVTKVAVPVDKPVVTATTRAAAGPDDGIEITAKEWLERLRHDWKNAPDDVRQKFAREVGIEPLVAAAKIKSLRYRLRRQAEMLKHAEERRRTAKGEIAHLCDELEARDGTAGHRRVGRGTGVEGRGEQPSCVRSS